MCASDSTRIVRIILEVNKTQNEQLFAFSCGRTGNVIELDKCKCILS